MPDWTYHPLRALTTAVLGVRRSQRAALHALATLTSLPGGARAIARTFDHPATPSDLTGRFGAAVPVAVARDAIRALPVQGASVIEVGPVGAGDVATIARATAGRRCQVIARVTTMDIAEQVAPHVDRVITASEPDLVYLHEPGIADAVAALADGAKTVLATPAVLIAAGPGWFQRVIEARTQTASAQTLRDIRFDPRKWPAWFWGLLVGVAMVGAGLGASLITIGPVLLWYDRAFLGSDLADLQAINHRLAHFLQHDRITMAGTMVAIGSLYIGLSWGGIRRGWPWARNAYLLSGAVGFPTLFYFLATGFVEPLHTAVAVVLFPMFLLATWRKPVRPRWTMLPEGPESQRRRALVGQLLMITTGFGLFIGGAVVSIVGLTDVFVPTDLTFLQASEASLHTANPHLIPFVAHDRAGFGGALMSAALAILLVSMWGWRRGEAWVWWSLLTAATAGFGPAIVVHLLIDYTSFEHLLPVYLGTIFAAVSLTLARPYLLSRSPGQ